MIDQNKTMWDKKRTNFKSKNKQSNKKSVITAEPSKSYQ